METKIAQPFTNIAVSLSGGGYRATTFHLGALSYLHSLQYQGQNMLQRVTVLSTISGGTLTGVMFALYLAKGRTFEGCYKKLHDLLSEDKLLERAFEKLNNTKAWNDKTKNKDLINAFSEVYNEYFFEDERFSTLFSDDTSHLKDVIFGATEFTTGIQFRFTENDDKGKFGNGNLYLPDDVAADVRLGDAAAASSCFPGGFEPIVMTKDFANGDDGPVAKTWEDKGYQTTGIMDGGIIDNQGIEGVELAEDRHSNSAKGPYIGTYIISDVAGKTMEPFEVPILKDSKVKNFFTFRRVNLMVGVLMAAIVALLYFLGPLHIIATAILSGLFTIGLIWFVVFFILKSALLGTLQKTIGKSNQPHLFKDMSIFFKTPIYILVYLVKFRATSVMKMVQDIFLRRIRALQLKRLYGDKDWNYRIESNNIYTLCNNKDISGKMTEVVNAANDMPTTLWFTDEQKKDRMLDKLIACGQFTLCFNLIDYIENKVKKRKKVWDSLDEATQQEIETLCQHLKKDFELFNENPLRMVE